MTSKFTDAIDSPPETSGNLVYVLVTPARNEAAFIERTIQSMVAQTVLPLRWVIVSDGSTDGTDEIVARYAAKYDWIELVRMPERKERNFAGKVHAFNAGYARVKDLDYDLIASLDADISFDENYFAFLVDKFSGNPRLGLAGTPFKEGDEKYDYRFVSVEHVSGACQLFRRQCFEAIGGYVPLDVGGIDLVAVITARMKGWETRTFTEKTCQHHKKTQSGKHQQLRRTFKSGYHDYLMGGHSLWQLFRSVYRMSKEPVIIGGSALLAGYSWAMLKRAKKPVSSELVAFRKNEQMNRLRELVRRRFVLVGTPSVQTKTSSNHGNTSPGNCTASANDLILVTGAAGFIGTRVVQNLLDRGYCNLRCLVRSSSNLAGLNAVLSLYPDNARPEVMIGNLLSREDCFRATQGVSIIYHLAAGTGIKSFSDAFMNSVVTTRNLLDATLQHKCLRRFISLSSIAVYAGDSKHRRVVLDESCPMEDQPERRAEAYCYAKVKQDELIIDYGRKYGLPYVLLRPGVVYGPGKGSITGRVGIDTFGVFLHFGGSNRIPFTYVENCADAIILAGLRPGVNGEVFNVVDDDLPSSREFLRWYKRNVRKFRSVYVPHWASYFFCFSWEKYSTWSEGQLPPVFTCKEWFSYWKKTAYSNQKLKRSLEWSPKVTTAEGLRLFFKYCRECDARA